MPHLRRYSAATLALADPAGALQIAEAARTEVATNRMAAYQVGDRIAWYRDLWARRQDLHAALLARLPQLAESADAHG